MLIIIISLGKRTIKAIPVKCDNVERGCTWVGTVGTLEEHVATCQFTLLPCPKECKDDSNKVKQIMRKDLEKHLKKDCPNRDYSCEHCGENGTYISIQVHDKTCEMKVVSCPKDGCCKIMKRRNIPYHIAAKCEHNPIHCKYMNIGCEEKLKRKDMAAHEQDDTVHLHMALDTINTLQNQCNIKFKLTDFEAIKEKNEGVQSPSYYTSPNGYCMAILVFANGNGDGEGTHVSVFAIIVEGRHDAQLKWPFIGDITFTLLNQLEDKNHRQVTATVTAVNNKQVGNNWGEPLFIRHSALDYDAVNNTQYLKDGTLYFRMSVEPADHKPWLQ